MDMYRDRLTRDFGHDVGSVVGCGLDRLDRLMSEAEIRQAIDYYNENKAQIDALPLNARREMITNRFCNPV
ncbi:hypothetical protein HF292_010445 [Acidithiobacillus ferruginosus]|uniref:Uncharacterized protein n=1 Tax=Acidithiobacillus ferruginosus TaxID=3063951 RepID=A0ACD5IEI9_9PROT|nr:hypothetical protein [Acidithiobacillus ferruginosus]MBU2814747.1 hypothetical protein [Acidithiobacillus ferruginosus]